MTRRVFWIGLLIAVVTAACYIDACHDGFIAFDDPEYVTSNPHVKAGLTWEGVRWAFTSTTAGNWHPLTMLSHMLDCQLYGLKPWGHHLTSVLLHAANAALVFWVFAALTGAEWPALAVAVLFAVHPTRVESVAWVSERKDVLCAFWFLLALLTYARYARARAAALPGRGLYAAVLVCFVLSLLAKPMAVTFPCVLLLLDFWPLRRGANWRAWGGLILEKLPLFAVTLAFCGATVWAQGVGKAIATGDQLPLTERLVHTPLSYLFYLKMLFWPAGLAVFYPYNHHESLWLATGAAVVLLGITVGCIRSAAKQPWLMVGWLWFAGMLIPVIGLVQVGGQAWADRYTYMPYLGLFLLLTVAVPKNARIAVFFAALVLCLVTGRQMKYWRDTRTLFQRATEVTTNNHVALSMLGTVSEGEGKLDEAQPLYRQSLAAKPSFPETHLFLGRTEEAKGQTNEAIKEYQSALRLNPDFAAAHVMLGLTLAAGHHATEAIAEYQAALKSDPRSAAAENDWGALLLAQDSAKESIPHFQAAVRLDPGLAAAHDGLGVALLKDGRVKEGADALRASLALQPAHDETRRALGAALCQQELWAEAEAVLRPSAGSAAPAAALFLHGLALEKLGRRAEALHDYRAALGQEKENIDALQHAAWIAATAPEPELRDGPQAVAWAAQARELTAHRRPSIILTLAAAQAASGKFADAAATAVEAETTARGLGDAALAAEAQRLAALFQAGRPYGAP